MTDTIQVEISSEQPAIAASLSELRYLVFQGMIGPDGKSAYELAVELGFEGTEEEWIASLVGPEGPAGAPGTTLGWAVTDDGEGNVEMTYPESQEGDTNAVLFVQQTLTPAQQTQARTNIGAASTAAVDNLADNVEEIDADVIALETLADEQASSDSVLEPVARAKGANATAVGMDFAKNDDGSFSIYGINTTNNNAIFYTSAASVTAAAAPKPPNGVYRLEISADQDADFTDVYGVLYIGSSSHYVITDAVGKSVEVYLDGKTSVSDGIVVSPGKNANGLKLTIALRRIGTPELGELLVDQINQMRGLQRKSESMLDTLVAYYKLSDKITNFLTSGQLTVPAVSSLTTNNDADELFGITSYAFIIARPGASTLNTPYAAGLTGTYSGGVIFHYNGEIPSGATTASYGVQFMLVSGSGQMFTRRKNLSGVSAWTEVT